jgi:hypothetical protein
VEAEFRGRTIVARLIACSLAILLLSCAVSPQARALEESCPNEARRIEQGTTTLPECRAYESVSQPNSEDASEIIGFYAFPEGDHLFFEDFLPLPGENAHNGLEESFLATRSPSGWQQTAISPPQGQGPSDISLGANEDARTGVGFTSDFATAFVNSIFQDPFEEPTFNPETGIAELLNQDSAINVYRIPIAGGAPERKATLAARPQAGPLTNALVDQPAVYSSLASANGWGTFFVGNSSDGSRVFFETTTALSTAPATPVDTHKASNEIYERADDDTYLVGILPNGTVPICGAEVSQGIGDTVTSRNFFSYGAVAANGTNVVFRTPGVSGGISVVPCTETESGLFLRNVVAGTTTKLEGEFFGGRAGTGAGEEEIIITLSPSNIYEYHVISGVTTIVGEGNLLAYSPNGTHVYYYTYGEHEGIYLYDNGQTIKVPIISSNGHEYGTGSLGDYGEILATESTPQTMPDMPAITDNGEELLFIDTEQVTEYDNEGHQEAYIYDNETKESTCLSCNPHGLPPEGEANLGGLQFEDPHAFHSPWHPYIFAKQGVTRAVFETTEALASQDTNEDDDVYEWVNGHIYLLSSGAGANVPNPSKIIDGTHLIGASEGLENIYMQSSEALLAGVDNGAHIYDARVGGGFPYTSVTHGCESGECKQQIAPPPTFSEPASAALFGAGNSKVIVGHTHITQVRKSTKLDKALRSCKHKQSKLKRHTCERSARKRYRTAKGAVYKNSRRRHARRSAK